jgi:hypothetical protein
MSPFVPVEPLPLGLLYAITSGICGAMNHIILGLTAVLAAGSLPGTKTGSPALQAVGAQSSYLLGLGIGDITG